jgi:predicted nuclease of predicted toxin-antitoxin system
MRLLFDENLAPQLVRRLADVFPGSVHVRDCGLKAVDDVAVWRHAREQGFVIVSKDEDFRHLSFLEGAPPKVVGIELGNCSTDLIEQLLRRRRAEIERFAADPVAAFLRLP